MLCPSKSGENVGSSKFPQTWMQDERDRVYDEKVVAADMLDFLKEFRIAHPSYFEAPLFVTGESYAGVPPICRLTQLSVAVCASASN
jgi:hypothetical protein